MHSYFKIIFREAKHITKDASLLLTLLVAPVLYSFIYGSIYINKGESKIKLAVVDADGTNISRFFVEQMNLTPMIDVISASDINDAKEKLYNGNVEGYLFIENGLEKKLLSLKQADISLAVNASRFLPSSDIMNTLTKISLTIGAGVRKTYFNKQGMSNTESLQMTNPINFDYRPLFNEGINYGSFLLPGLLAIILQQTLLIGLCASMTTEREKNKLGHLIRISDNNITKALIGKGTFYFFTFMIFGLFFVIVNFRVLGISVRGSYFSLAVLTALFLIAIIPLAMLIGSFFKKGLIAFQVMGFSSYPIFLVTGYSLPSQSLPLMIQWLASILPTTPFLKTYLSILQAGGRLKDNIPHLLHLVILAGLFFLCLWFRIRYLMQKEQRGMIG